MSDENGQKNYNEYSRDKKDCNTCKCLSCEHGMLFPGNCPSGTNCAICKSTSVLTNYKTQCPYFKSGY